MDPSSTCAMRSGRRRLHNAQVDAMVPWIDLPEGQGRHHAPVRHRSQRRRSCSIWLGRFIGVLRYSLSLDPVVLLGLRDWLATLVSTMILFEAPVALVSMQFGHLALVPLHFPAW